ncbi:uncharacterized protein LOC142331045 isoform X2 [Lycorma delicatula]|uniref:uncharacterized protein LOC142331045 isoform X2 n=1 Tax=Lycorma delicatula TaxID=130591 RepID=UPI003F5156A2
MERPERPSRPEKVIRNPGIHPYRERHRIVSSDSESDMEIDYSAPLRLRAMRLQRPSRPSVEALSGVPMQNSNPVGNSSTAASSSSSDPYIPSPIRHIRDTQNGESQSLYPFMIKDDPCHRQTTLFYRKRPGPQHFLPPLSDVLERRSTSRNCTRVRFASPHLSGPSASNWEAKRFCSGPTDPLATGPEQKIQHTSGSGLHRIVATAAAGSSQNLLLEPHSSAASSDRSERDDLRTRPTVPWSSPSEAPANCSLLDSMDDDDDDNPLRNMLGTSIEGEPLNLGTNDLGDSSVRSTHNAVGTLDLSCPLPPNIIPPPLHPVPTATSVAAREPGPNSSNNTVNNSNNSSNNGSNMNSNSNNTNNNSNNNNNNNNSPVPCASVEPIVNNGHQYDNTVPENSSNIVILSDPMSYELRDSSSRLSRRYRHGSHGSENNTEHPTRASSHLLRALDEFRFAPMSGPWSSPVQRIDHSFDPGVEIPARTNNPNLLSNLPLTPRESLPSSQLNRRRLDLNVTDGSDAEQEEDSDELIERVTAGPRFVSVDDISDQEIYETINDNHEGERGGQARTVDHTPDYSSSAGNNAEMIVENNEGAQPFEENGIATDVPGNSHTEEPNQHNGNEVGSYNQYDRNANNVVNCDDVIIIATTPSPVRLQQQDAHSATPVPPAPPPSVSTAADVLAGGDATATTSATTQEHQQLNTNINSLSALESSSNQNDSLFLDSQEFNSKLVSLLECPVCMETIVPPIHQCRKGHPVCSVCRPKLTLCPTCRARFSENRNLLMEKVAEMMLFPCKNVQLGCPVNVQLKDKRNHELSCGFRLYDCIVGPCTWKGFKQELVVHVSTGHRNRVIVGNNQKIKVPLELNLQSIWVLSALDEVFIVTFINKDGFLRGRTIYLGNAENARNYFYEFIVAGKNGMRLSWREKTCEDDGQAIGLNLFRDGFCCLTNHSIIEDRLPRAQIGVFTVEVTINVFRIESN